MHEIVIDPHSNRRVDGGKRVDHRSSQRPIAQAGQGSGVNGIEQGPRLAGREHRRFAFLQCGLRPAHGVSGIHGEDLAGRHPVEKHPQHGQPLVHNRLGVLSQSVLDESRDVDQLRLGEIHDAVLSAERGELPDRFHVRASGVLVVDIGT